MFIRSNNKELNLSSPHIMGILNVTPDSFSDGGQFNGIDDALNQARSMISAGATIIDIGGESTRPGAPDVTLEEEIKRVIPVIKALRAESDVWISIDTSKAEVMRQATIAGADIINDVRALQEPGALQAAAQAKVPVCLMHMQGQPKTMQENPKYQDLLEDIDGFLAERISACESAGIQREQLILDPGFGFGKTIEHNYHLLANLDKFHRFGLPILAGMSRKSMIFKVLEKEPKECLIGSVTCASISALKGAHIIRVHDVVETVEAIKIINTIGANQ
ncbi:dihydropteroate synthase [Vibrio sp. S9_S30]|uniref:dihydropteroate synthase n=1 Tax=Vibrio sp. S9_S30 TaxID=2720226 RepID=UPI001681B37B|nr:dihydropteroate synthase [Vibrio sp. S9_S30]MBD1555602.1 dihydropteroate synthase [Vibrio sp. S9_S30]